MRRLKPASSQRALSYSSLNVDEYYERKCQVGRQVYDHPEHARWHVLLSKLGFQANYKPRCHEYATSELGFKYVPAFFCPDLYVFIDVRRRRPYDGTIAAAASLYRETGYPSAVFFEPLKVPAQGGLPARCTLVHDSASVTDHFLVRRDGVYAIRIMQNGEPMEESLLAATSAALTYPRHALL